MSLCDSRCSLAMTGRIVGLALAYMLLLGLMTLLASDVPGAQTADGEATGGLPKGAIARLGTTMLRHAPGQLKALSYSPKGGIFATGGHKAIIIWDAKSATARTRIPVDYPVTVRSLDFFPDGTRLAISKIIPMAGSAVEIIDLKGHTVTRISSQRPDRGGVVVVSPDGRFVAFNDHDRGRNITEAGPKGKQRQRSIYQIHLWSTKTQELFLKLDGPPQPFYTIAFTRDGKYVAAAASSRFPRDSEPTPVLLWDIATGKRVRVFAGHGAGMCSLAFSPDDSVLVGGGGDSKIHFWNVKTGKYLSAIVTNSCHRVAWSPRDNVLASSSPSPLPVCLWNPKTGKLIRELTKAEDRCHYVAFSPDGKQLVTAGSSPTIRVWDVATGKEIGAGDGHTSAIFSLAFSHSGNLLASRSGDQTVRLWDVSKRSTLRTLKLAADSSSSGSGPFSSFAAGLRFTSDGSLLAANCMGLVDIDVKARVWDVGSGKEIAALGKHFRHVPNGIAFMPDGKAVITAGFGGSRLHSLPDGKEVPSFFGPVKETPEESYDTCVSVSPTGRLLVVGSSRDLLRFLDARTGKLVREVPCSKWGAINAVFSPDGRLLATGGGWPGRALARQNIQLW
jgi:WD40 repeat protein